MIVSIICVTTISILTTGCLTTTQKSTTVGTGGGAGDVGGALVGNHMDKKREGLGC